jgi:hypothetical protein
MLFGSVRQIKAATRLVSCVLLCMHSLAVAHGIAVWAEMRDGGVHVEGYYSDGTRVGQGRVVVFGATGDKLLEGEVSASKAFVFQPPRRGSLTIQVIPDRGHRGSTTLSLDDRDGVAVR